MFPYNVYKFSLKRLWGSPITFTILPITIKDFPCNFIVVSLCIVFPYHFYKYRMYFPRKSLQTFAVYKNSFDQIELKVPFSVFHLRIRRKFTLSLFLLLICKKLPFVGEKISSEENSSAHLFKQILKPQTST